jgi:signal transduction histidine kinase
MKAWPLRLKIALWSCLSACIAMSAALLGIYFILRTELREFIDRRMDSEQKEVFWDLDHLVRAGDGPIEKRSGPVENRTEITDDLMPRSSATWLVEIWSPKKKEFSSPSLEARSLAEGPLFHHEIEHQGRSYLVGTYYHKYLTLHLAAPLDEYYATLQKVKWAGLLVLPGVLIVSLLGGIFVAARAVRPVTAIAETAREITAEHLDERLPLPGARDEIYDLTLVLNETFGRLEKSYHQAIHFASDASHQLKTPITVMRVAIDDVLRDPTLPPEHFAAISDVLQQTRRLGALVEGLLLLAQADAGRLKVQLVETDILLVVQACLEDAEVLAQSDRIKIEYDLPDALPAFADRLRIEQILLNLLENAVKYNHPGGTVRLRAETDGLGASIIVANTGPAIPADRLPHVFDRFVRGEANEARKGHGLGLTLARELARAQGGELSLLRSDGQWTEFEVRLRVSSKMSKDIAELVPSRK